MIVIYLLNTLTDILPKNSLSSSALKDLSGEALPSPPLAEPVPTFRFRICPSFPAASVAFPFPFSVAALA